MRQLSEKVFIGFLDYLGKLCHQVEREMNRKSPIRLLEKTSIYDMHYGELLWVKNTKKAYYLCPINNVILTQSFKGEFLVPTREFSIEYKMTNDFDTDAEKITTQFLEKENQVYKLLRPYIRKCDQVIISFLQNITMMPKEPFDKHVCVCLYEVGYVCFKD